MEEKKVDRIEYGRQPCGVHVEAHDPLPHLDLRLTTTFDPGAILLKLEKSCMQDLHAEELVLRLAL